MDQNNDNKPVTHAYLRDVLTKVDVSLQEYSQAIANLQKSHKSTGADNAKIQEIERSMALLHQKIQNTIQDDRKDDYTQSTSQQQLERLENRLDQIERLENRIEQLERLEKSEEYDQNNLENDFQQLQNDFQNMERQIRDINYKLQRMS